jgi:hypothetical protein
VSGILDNKTRILDTAITTLGREQLAFGGIDISYVTITDAAAFYQADAVSGTSDATNRIYFEVCNLPQDDITFRSDDSGFLTPFKSSITASMRAGQMIEYSFNASTSSIIEGSAERTFSVTGSGLFSLANKLLQGSPDNFKKLLAIGTHDDIFDDGFAVGPTAITFVTNENIPMSLDNRVQNINRIESLISDPKLSHLPNFQYLPPIYKTENQSVNKSDINDLKNYLIGDYKPLGRSQKLTPEIIFSELKRFEKSGFMKSISIDPSSKFNNLLCQVFEISNTATSKLDVIDFGNVVFEGKIKHIFFLGKLLTDDNALQKFLHIFTLVFE